MIRSTRNTKMKKSLKKSRVSCNHRRKNESITDGEPTEPHQKLTSWCTLMKRVIRLFGHSNRDSQAPKTLSNDLQPSQLEEITTPATEEILENKIREIKCLLEKNGKKNQKTGRILQIIDLLITSGLLKILFRKDKKLFSKIVKFLEREANNTNNPEYMNIRMTLVTLKHLTGDRKVFLRFLGQLEKNNKYHNEAAILRLALEQGWKPSRGRIIVDCIVSCENCGKKRKVERIISPTQIKEFYLNPCESCGGTNYVLARINGQSVIQWSKQQILDKK